MHRIFQSRFYLMGMAGTFFAAALLFQILTAQMGWFGETGSVIAILALLLLVATTAGTLALTWSRASSGVAGSSCGKVSTAGSVGVIVAMTAGVFCFLRWVNPSENIMGGNDEGIYGITAANLARTGQYQLHAELLPSLPSQLRPWIIDEQPQMANRTAKPPPRYPCYRVCLFIKNEQAGTVTSQFPVGFPALLGSAHSIFGFKGQQLVNPTLLVLSACIAGLLFTSWLGTTSGVAAFLLWLWFPLQIWGGNTRYSEMLLQLLWLITLLGIAERKKNTPSWSGAMAGLALGASLAVKIDALPVIAVTAAAVSLGTDYTERGFLRAFFLTLLASLTISITSVWENNQAYVLDTLRSLAETNRKPLVCGAILLLAGAVALALARKNRWWAKVRENWPVLRLWFEYGTIVIGLGLAADAYFIRSNPSNPDSFFYWPQNRVILSYREETFLRLGWYWQPWGLAISMLGICALIRSARDIWHGLIVGMGLLFLVSFSYDIRNNPIEPYAMRRFLPYAIPLMILGAAGLSRLVPALWPRTRAWLSIVATAILLLGFGAVNERLSRQSAYPNLFEQVAQLARQVPTNAVILVSENNQLVRLASAVEFIFGKPTLSVHQIANHTENQLGRERALRDALRFWRGEGRTVYLLSPDVGETLGIPGVTAKPVHQGVISTKAVIPSDKSLVTEPTISDMHYVLNELDLIRPSNPASSHRSP